VVLRSLIPYQWRAGQLIDPPPESFALAVLDIVYLPEAEQRERLQQHIDSERERVIDPACDRMLQATVVRLSSTRHVLVQILLHVASDGLSNLMLEQELATLYDAFSRGQPSPLPEQRVQYADFASWQRERFRGDLLESYRTFWTRQVEGVPKWAWRVPDGGVAEVPYLIEAPLVAALTRRSQAEGTTLFMTLATAYVAMLHQATGERDIAFVAPAANRSHPDTETMQGCFFNTLVFRTSLAGLTTLRELLRRVRTTVLDAVAHQEVSWMLLVPQDHPMLAPDRRWFQAAFNFVERSPPRRIGELLVEQSDSFMRRYQGQELNFKLTYWKGGDTMLGVPQWNQGVISDQQGRRLWAAFERILGDLAADPERGIGP
jgi:hypothetical protein